jgi:hypothetical protein
VADPLDPLVQALALGEGFQLLLLVVSSEDAADAALGRLQRRLGEVQLGAMLARLGPPPGDVDVPTLERAILDPLPGPANAAALVIDASSATNRDEPAWEEVFRRLNTRRNGISRQVDRALILCLPPRMEQLFAREAPDFWSIRSVRVELTAASPRRSPLHAEVTLRFEDLVGAGLPDALARVFPERAEALTFLAGLGFPPARLPLSDTADFWVRVLREADRGAFPGGLETLVRAAFRRAPGDAVLAQLHDALPERQRAAWEWVIPAEAVASDYIEAPWEPALRERLNAMRDGDRLALVGEEGAGRWTALESWAPVGTGRPACVIRTRHPFPEDDIARGLAALLTAVDPSLAAVLRAAADQRLAAPQALACLPGEVRARLPADPLASLDIGGLWALLKHALNVAHGVADVVVLWRPRDAYRMHSAFSRWPGRCAVVVSPRWPLAPKASSFEVPRADPEHLRALLARRVSRADARTRLLLDTPATASMLADLADVASSPGVYLRWVQRLLRTWPLPPPPEALTPVGWAAALGASESAVAAVAAGRLLDAGPRPVHAVLDALGTEPARGLVDRGVLVRAPDEHHLAIAPAYDLLRPSVCARLRD